MIAASVLFFVFILFVTGCGIVLTKVGTTSGHLVASAAGAFGCVLASAAATIVISLSGVLRPI